MGKRFTSGKYAKAMCDRCGIEVKYVNLKLEWTGLKVCGDCWDPKTALEFPKNFPADPEALRDPRTDNDVEAGQGRIYVAPLIGNTFPGFVVEFEIGVLTVEVV